MSGVKSNELRIVAFLCNWCSYGGADTAGVARATQPTDLRIIRVPCSGRVDPLFVMKALFNGADGVLVSGCHPRDCHYSTGNFYARRRLEVLKHFLPILGIDPGRFEYTWVSASEGERWKHVVTRFTEQIHALGPAPRFDDADTMTSVVQTALSPIAPLRCGESNLESIKSCIRDRLQSVDCVLGWKMGRDALHTVPYCIRKEADLDELVVGPTSVHNLANYLRDHRGKKTGILVKGCDAKSVVELLQEKLIRREDIVILSYPCTGTFDMARVEQDLGRYQTLDAVSMTETALCVTADGKEHIFPIEQYAQSKCYFCTERMAQLSDYAFGAADTPKDKAAPKDTPPELALLDSLSLPERMAFWKTNMERCIRCYACRNSCPLCVCRDYCISDTRDPHWTTQNDTSKEKLFFQVIHSLHLAGRCTGCGECQRSCPVGIPILALRQHIARTIRELFAGYEPGTDPNAVPPLLGYAAEEQSIKEREW
ncbi:MAG: hydrogenase iron-sulfur subunit [Desulfovibrionaceae bacterium]|nr:hydrogenase iron-sulfur subunit [Desulfovibrionaceae bacterium]